MKIILTSFYLPPTDRIGAGVQMHMVANAYVALGHDVTVVSPRNVLDPDARYKLMTIPINGPNLVLKWAIELAKIKFDADFVHFSGDDFLVRRNRSFVHMRTFLGSCFAEARYSSTVSGKFRMSYLGMTEFVSSEKSDICTCISHDTNRYFRRKSHVIPCGVDLSVFSTKNTKSAVPTIMFVGTLDSRKRGRLLLDLFESSISSRVDNARLWLVRESSKVNLHNVTSFGSVELSRLIDLYQNAWVFCLPSSYEGFGVPYIEAMACGTPVVATPNAGAMEVLGKGEFGVITHPDQLAESLISLLTDADKRQYYSRLGLSRVREYDILNIANSYIKLVRDFRQ